MQVAAKRQRTDPEASLLADVVARKLRRATPSHKDDPSTSEDLQRFAAQLGSASLQQDEGRPALTPDMRSALKQAAGQLQALADDLEATLARNTLPDMPHFCRRTHTPAEAQELVAYAHRLSFTTFAPPGYPEQPLGLFRPPNPQDWQMHASLLHAFKRKHDALMAGQAAVPEADSPSQVGWAPGQPQAAKEAAEAVAPAPPEVAPAPVPAAKPALIDFRLGQDSDEDVEESYSSSSEGE